jgi:hypothetical protein
MYTFGILVVFSFLLSAAIFGKKIKERQFETGCIVFATTFIGMVIVNGVVGLKIPYTITKVKQHELWWRETTIKADTTVKFASLLRYKFEVSKKDTTQYMDFNNYAGYLHAKTTRFVLLDRHDTITKPYYEKFREVRQTDNKWISSLGLPKGEVSFVFYLPDDSVTHKFLHYAHKYFFRDENTKTAQLN